MVLPPEVLLPWPKKFKSFKAFIIVANIISTTLHYLFLIRNKSAVGSPLAHNEPEQFFFGKTLPANDT